MRGVGARAGIVATAVLALAACAPATKPGSIRINANPFPSTYARYPAAATVIRGATVYDGEGGRIEQGVVLLRDGLVAAVGANNAVAVPADAVVIDGTGKYVTPGIIDVHSHLGNYPSPGVQPHQDGNEATDPARPDVWAEHSVWP